MELVVRLELHLTQDDLEAHHRRVRGLVEGSRWHFLRLLPRGLSATW
jgi:hypothetical protein